MKLSSLILFLTVAMLHGQAAHDWRVTKRNAANTSFVTYSIPEPGADMFLKWNNTTNDFEWSMAQNTWVDLAGGTVLTVGNSYWDTLSAIRTLTFSGSPVDGDIIELSLVVTGGPHVLTIPSSLRVGTTSTSTSVTLQTGNNYLKWTRKNATWQLVDSGVEPEAAFTFLGNMTSSAAAPAFFATDTPAVGEVLAYNASGDVRWIPSGGPFAADAGANDTYTATLSPVPTAYVTGQSYRFMANTANTGAATINFNTLGAKTIKKVSGGITTDLVDNDIRAGQWVNLTYDGTNMQMASQSGNGGGYTLMTEYTGSMTWVDGLSAYYGLIDTAQAVSAANYNLVKIEVPKTGVVKRIWIKVSYSTTGSGETINVFARLNDTTDFGTISFAFAGVSPVHATDSTVSQAVTAGDYLAVKVVCPTFATDPTQVRLAAVIYIE